MTYTYVAEYGETYKKACEQAARDANVYKIVRETNEYQDLLSVDKQAEETCLKARDDLFLELSKSGKLEEFLHNGVYYINNNEHTEALCAASSKAHEALMDYVHNYYTCPIFEFKSDDLTTCNLPGVELVDGSCVGLISDAKLGTLYYPGYAHDM